MPINNPPVIPPSSPSEVDAVVDDTGFGDFTTIQAAIDAFPTGSIKVRRGTLNESTIVLSSANDGLDIEGENQYGTIWRNSTNLLNVAGSGTIPNIKIHNLTMRDTGSGNIIDMGGGANCTKWKLFDIFFDDTGNTSRAIRTVTGGLQDFINVFRCEFTGFNFSAMSLYGGAGVADWNIINNHFHDMTTFPGGIDTFVNSKRMNINNNQFDNVHSAVFMNGSGNEGHTVSFNVINGGVNGIATASAIVNCSIVGNTVTGTTTQGISLGTATGVTVTGNNVFNCTANGLNINNTTDCIFIGNNNRGNGNDFNKSGTNTGLISDNNRVN